MKNKNCNFTLVVAAVVLSVIFLAPCPETFAQKKPTVLRLVVPSLPGEAGYPYTTVSERIAKGFNERANGEYIIEVYAGGAIVQLPEYFNSVRLGIVDIASGPWVVFSFLEPKLAAFELPFLYNSNKAFNYALKKSIPLYDQILQKKFNAKALGAMNLGSLEMFNSKNAIKKIEDLNGILVGAISPTLTKICKELGASPVTIMWSDLYMSLQKNVIDSAIIGVHAGLMASLPDVCKHVTYSNMSYGMNGFSINLDVWKKMPENIQIILQEEVEKGTDWMSSTVLEQLENDTIESLKQKGTNVFFVTSTERERWKNATKSFRDDQLKSYGEFGIEIKKHADEANMKYPYTMGN